VALWLSLLADARLHRWQNKPVGVAPALVCHGFMLLFVRLINKLAPFLALLSSLFSRIAAEPDLTDVWTKHPPRRDPVLLERVPINPLGYRNRRHPDFNYNEPPKLVYKADHVRAQFRKDYIDSPISCLTSQQTVMPLSDRVACRMVERNYGDWDGIDVTSLRSNALYHRLGGRNFFLE